MGNEELIKQVTEKAEKWLTPAYDAETQAEVKRMLENEDKTELIEAFYKDLEFGTGGLRGIMGVGTNRMNIYTVGAATQGLSNYLNANFKNLKQISVVVGYDCRNNSSLFAKISADIFSANGIKVYLFEEMRPTPEMSFAIRHLGCQSGIILTASHNPKEYNGYKAYWDDGAQVLAPHDKGIIDEVNKIASAADIKFQGNPELIQIIGEDVDKIYLDMVKTVSIDPEAIARHKDMKIVYTPIHGTGMMLIPRALKMWGFENVYTVPEQMIKDGNFPTVVSPNPENAEALTMALNLAKEIDADLVMASDPDADRVGIACKDDKGEWVLINGNQTCLMYLYYIITQYNKLGKMTGNEFCVKTIVTTELIKKIADKNHIEMLDCYTGFKWIAREIRLRQGTQKAKTRSEVSGGGRKPWRQKGTGHARQGSTRAPQWTGGGMVFAPTPRDYTIRLNKKEKRAALKSALTSRVNENKFIVVDSLSFDEIKTKNFKAVMDNLKVSKALVVLDEESTNAAISAKNIPTVKTARVNTINVYDILKYNTVVATKAAVASIEEVYA